MTNSPAKISSPHSEQDHGLKSTDADQTLGAWHHAFLNRRPLPRFTWQRSADGTLAVTAKTQPSSVLLWQATNLAAGWTASCIELTFDGGATAPLTLTTDITGTAESPTAPG